MDCYLYDGIATPHARRMIFADYTSVMTNEQIASLLNHYALLNRSGLARAAMQEAAKRLRGDAGLIAAVPTPPSNPPLKAEAIPDGS